MLNKKKPYYIPRSQLSPEELEKARVRDRLYKQHRYHTEPEFKEKQLQYNRDYQKNLYAKSEEFRALKLFQKHNPVKEGRGRPRKSIETSPVSNYVKGFNNA